MYTYVPISPPSCVSLPPSLSHPSKWSQSIELISPCYAVTSHQLAILHLVVYICQCYSLTSSQLTLPPPHVLKSILYVGVFIPVLALGSSETFFFFLNFIYLFILYIRFLLLIYFIHISVYMPIPISQFRKYGTLHKFVCHPCTGAMLIFSVSFQFQYMYCQSEHK